jgi:MoxR-like ATPase
MTVSNPSVPAVPAPLRQLTDAELVSLLRIADSLMPAGRGRPAASEAPGYGRRLDVALRARSDAFDDVVSVAADLSEVATAELLGALRTLSVERPVAFAAVSSVLAGAYLLLPEIRRSINYPGQEARPARFDEAAEEIMDGILDPVLARGHFYRSDSTD